MREAKQVPQRLSTEPHYWTYRVEGSPDPDDAMVEVYDEETDLGRALAAYARCPYQYKSLVRVVCVVVDDKVDSDSQ